MLLVILKLIIPYEDIQILVPKEYSIVLLRKNFCLSSNVYMYIYISNIIRSLKLQKKKKEEKSQKPIEYLRK